MSLLDRGIGCSCKRGRFHFPAPFDCTFQQIIAGDAPLPRGGKSILPSHQSFAKMRASSPNKGTPRRCTEDNGVSRNVIKSSFKANVDASAALVVMGSNFEGIPRRLPLFVRAEKRITVFRSADGNRAHNAAATAKFLWEVSTFKI